MKNIIILTSGLSGSSVVTHFLSQAGYWSGDKTCKKSTYNTHENQQLIDLNKQLLKYIDYEKDYMHIVKKEKIIAVEKIVSQIDIEPFEQFIKDCNQSEPWIWKDPRLWITLPFWMKILKKESIQFVFVDRKVSQRWISELLRKNIQTVEYCKEYSEQIEQLCKETLHRYRQPYLDVLYDDLIMKPVGTVESINQYLGTNLSLRDLKKVYNKRLYKKPRGLTSLFLAVLIYIKNYHLRTK